MSNKLKKSWFKGLNPYISKDEVLN